MIKYILMVMSLVLFANSSYAESWVMKTPILAKMSDRSVSFMVKACGFTLETEVPTAGTHKQSNLQPARYFVFEGSSKKDVLASRKSAYVCLLDAAAGLGEMGRSPT